MRSDPNHILARSPRFTRGGAHEEFCFVLAWRRELRRVEFFPSIEAFAVVVRLGLEARIKAHAKPPPNGLDLKFSNPKLVRDPRHSAHVINPLTNAIGWRRPIGYDYQRKLTEVWRDNEHEHC